jgi:ribosome recycling factor
VLNQKNEEITNLIRLNNRELSCPCADYKNECEKILNHLSDSLKTIRSTSISIGLIENLSIKLDNTQPLKNLGFVGKNPNNSLFFESYDPSKLGQINKILVESGFNAYVFSKTRLCISSSESLQEDQEKIKSMIKKHGENAKIAIRNVRQNYRKKNKETKDDKEIQALTDAYNRQIDSLIYNKLSSKL